MPKIANVIQEYRKIYQNILPTFSPAIGEKVYFNMKGFKHLIFKNAHRRSNKVIYSRLVLVPFITDVIENCAKVAEIRKRKESGKKVVYVAIESEVESGAKIRVVLRKDGKNGKFHFQSIMKCK